EDALLGLRSVHVYDSLMARSFADYVERWSPGAVTQAGRAFRSLGDERALGAPELRCLGVAAVVSDRPLGRVDLDPPGQVDGRFVYRAKALPILTGLEVLGAGGERGRQVGVACASPDRPGMPIARPEVLERSDDTWRVRLPPGHGPSLLWLSSAYHPRWR